MWPKSRCTATNSFLVVIMIWCSYTDKMGYSWEIDWNLHHQHFQFFLRFKENNKNDMTFCYFSCLGQYCSAHIYGSFDSPSSCWRLPRWVLYTSVIKESGSLFFPDSCTSLVFWLFKCIQYDWNLHWKWKKHSVMTFHCLVKLLSQKSQER